MLCCEISRSACGTANALIDAFPQQIWSIGLTSVDEVV
jgi:hypothetical protein